MTDTRQTDMLERVITAVTEAATETNMDIHMLAQIRRAISNIKPKTHSVLDTQEGGDHYKKLGAYQPWEVLRRWLTPEEFRGYMKGTAIAYLAREQDKGGMLDIRKAGHTLQGLVELLGAE